MSTAIESFDLNDLRKSTRILLPGRATLRGAELKIADWSFEGFRAIDTRKLGRVEVNASVDITFALHDSAFHFDFKHPARVVWSTETHIGFEWLLALPTQVRVLLRQYLVSQHAVIPGEPETHISSLSLKIVPPNIEPAQTDPPQQINNQRKSRLVGYAIASLLLLMAITFLGYENQFVVSTRALYLGDLAEVVATTDGMIDKILVKRGDLVNVGDAVAILDGRDLDIQKSAMERLVMERVDAVKVARSAVAEISTPLSMYAEVANQQRAVAHAKVAEARATMNLRKGYYERLLELDHNGQIGKSELERASAEAESASSHHQASVEEAMLAEKVATEAKAGRFFNGNKVDNDLQLFRVGLTQRLADLAQTELDLARADAQRRNSTIYAKSSGHVFSIERPMGQYVKSGERVIVLSADALPMVVARFDPKDAAQLRPGAAATVYANGGSQTIEARISEIGHTRISHGHPFASLIESQLIDIPVEFELASIPAAFFPGMPVEVKVDIGRLSSMFRGAAASTGQ